MSNVILYSSPFVPPEWIAAHGLRPVRTGPLPGEPHEVTAAMGMCPYAAMVCAHARQSVAAGVVFTTTCDQMRRAAETVAQPRTLLLAVPSTWQSSTSRAMYRDDLMRLGRWLQTLGGTAPTPEQLAQMMLRYERARQELRQRRDCLSARDYALSIAHFGATGELPPFTAQRIADGAAIAIVGGPLRHSDLRLLDLVEQAGGRIVLDATETGERGLVGAFDHRNTLTEPFDELVEAYFSSIPEAFRRPNDHLYGYLRHEIAQRQVRGIVLVRRVWCDQWHAELVLLREATGLPVVEVDLNISDGGDAERNRTRIESLLEILR